MINSIGESTEKFHAKIEVNIYSSSRSKTPHITKSCEIKKNGNDFYYQIDLNRILINKNCTVLINDESKSVIYSKISEQLEFDKSILINVDSLISKYDSVRFGGTKNGVKNYSIFRSDNIIPVTDIYINVSKKSIEKLVYHYNEKKFPSNNLVEILYTKWSASPNFSASDFSEKKYITKTKLNYTLIGSLSSYELIINEPEH